MRCHEQINQIYTNKYRVEQESPKRELDKWLCWPPSAVQRRQRRREARCEGRGTDAPADYGKRDSIHHHLLEAISETANVLELRQKLLCTTPSGWWWWWCRKSFFRDRVRGRAPSFKGPVFVNNEKGITIHAHKHNINITYKHDNHHKTIIIIIISSSNNIKDLGLRVPRGNEEHLVLGVESAWKPYLDAPPPIVSMIAMVIAIINHSYHHYYYGYIDI